MSKRSHRSYAAYVNRVARRVDPGASLSAGSVQVLDGMIHYLVERYASTVSLLVRTSDARTVNAMDIQMVTSMLILERRGTLHGMRRRAIEAATKRHQTYMNNRKSNDPRLRPGYKADLDISPARIRAEFLSYLSGTQRMRPGSMVYLAAVVMEILSILIFKALKIKGKDTKRIIPRHIFLAVQERTPTEDLAALFRGIIPRGGVVSNIHEVLVKKRAKKETTDA